MIYLKNIHYEIFFNLIQRIIFILNALYLRIHLFRFFILINFLLFMYPFYAVIIILHPLSIFFIIILIIFFH